MYTAKHTFFCQSLDGGILSEEESNHAVRVLRLQEGNTITLIDGKGQTALGEITVANKKQLHFNITERQQLPARPNQIHIAIAPTKNMDRFSFFIEKVIEIGIDRITPIITVNSERKVLNEEKVRKNAISALKQSGNLFLPKIDDLTTFKEFISDQSNHNQRFIAHCDSDTDKIELKQAVDPKKNVVILIGPEGDFTLEEINLAKQNKFNPVSLGESRLRTETAGIVACHTVHLIS
ncbi:MAG: 16S rRNA (uracil(1498)-N(3))-methyltransferase [Crocinitomix sp.]|nr:16S rRNA (uracil(1498)-N(3))-methyltransferase [Crocinitomix sp.]